MGDLCFPFSLLNVNIKAYPSLTGVFLTEQRENYNSLESRKEYYKTSVVTHIVMSRLDSNSPFRFIY